MKKIDKRTKEIILKVLVIIFIAIFLIYVSRKIYNFVKEPTDSFMIEYGTITSSENAEAYIIRNETILSGENSNNGIEKTKVEGEKIAKGDSVYRCYVNGEEELTAKIEELNSKIQEAQETEATNIYNTDIENLRKNIKEILEKMYKENNIDDIEKYRKQINEYTNKISEIIGEKSPSGSYLQNLIKERNQYTDKLYQNAEIVKAPESGTVSYRIDNLENLLTTDNFDYIDKEFLDNLNLKSDELIESSSTTGKIITDFYCYLATVLYSDVSKSAEVGDKVQIDIGSSEKVEGTIVQINNIDEKSRIIIFKVGSLSENLLNYRKISVNVVWWKDSGLKVPNSAIIEENGLKYVVRNREGYDNKVLINIIRQNEDYSIIDNYSTSQLQEIGYSAEEIRNMYQVKLYDRIKTNPK